MYKKALISVSDKTGLEEFLTPLVAKGLKLVSTGGTGKFLKTKGFEVIDVKDVTNFPEVLSGRVKTLHPHIHIGLLAREWIESDQETLKQYGLEPFDLVVGNLYPFEQKTDNLEDKELVEWIDVGGPSFLRAAAKNYFSITTICSPEDYKEAQEGTTLKQRKELAAKLFQRLSNYDAFISQKLTGEKVEVSEKERSVKGSFFKELRYGENPHQKASWYTKEKVGLQQAEILQGKILSYNNLLDFSEAVNAVRDFDEPCVVAIKHNNPCGVAIGKNISLALERALKADPLSVFGGLLAINRPFDLACSQQLDKLFLEGVIAPDFSAEALEHMKVKKNLRLLKWPTMLVPEHSRNSFREILGGFLLQTKDHVLSHFPKDWDVYGQSPSEKVKKDLIFSWKVAKNLKSNAIAVVKDGQSLGLGMGQVNRVDAVHLALNRIQQFHSHQKNDLILASDAFFPFPDSIVLAAKAGVNWIIQPGGSVNDKKVLEKTKELGVNMILTGQRHFKH